jgi:hypothetical protein
MITLQIIRLTYLYVDVSCNAEHIEYSEYCESKEFSLPVFVFYCCETVLVFIAK